MTTSTTPPSTRDLLAEFVGRRCAALADGYQRDDGAAVAVLARLRRASGSGGLLSVDADVWDVFEAMPERLMGGDRDPSRAELAAVACLVLFATHQQSRSDAPMHVLGHEHSLGRAVGRLSRAHQTPGVQRRFRSLTRTAALEPAVVHLRGLVSLLRADRVPLDYSRLAADLLQLQHPGGVQTVRMRWVRDFHRVDRPADPADPASTDHTTTTGDPS